MLYVYLEAPFAACRTFTAGWYRPTATFLTPTAAYGLLLNVAGIDARLREEDQDHDGKTPASLMRAELPAVRLALGLPIGMEMPRVATVFQQLHNYPVGPSGKAHAANTFGNKYNITPVRREFLTNMRAIIAVDGNNDIEELVRRGLRGQRRPDCYGLPFLGDNNFLSSRLEESPASRARWYCRIREGCDGPRPHTTRLTEWINRADLSQTRSQLFAPSEEPTDHVPEPAWTLIPPTTSS